jgi:Domain of unknown function (DUF4416)
MGKPKEPKPAKYFVALLSSHIELLASVETDLAVILGAIDERSETLPWNCSRFYEEEMGSGLLRRFVSFRSLSSPEKLADVKLATQQVEEKYRSQTADRYGRSVNLDPGYLEAGKVVLASTKNASQRIYLRSGVFAEATLLYHDGVFHGASYTYQDYLWPETLGFLTCLRSIYLAQLKQLG